jgi:hypothetical protein
LWRLASCGSRGARTKSRCPQAIGAIPDSEHISLNIFSAASACTLSLLRRRADAAGASRLLGVAGMGAVHERTPGADDVASPLKGI